MSNVQAFTGKIYAGHVRLSIDGDGTLDFSFDERWQHDLLPQADAAQLIAEGIRDGERDWPQGLYHVYVNADAADTKKRVINVYDCACTAVPEKGGKS